MASAPKTMSQFYRQGGVTRLGGNARTRGRSRAIQQVTQTRGRNA